MSSLETLQVGGFKRPKGTHILPLDPSIIHIGCTKGSKLSGEGLEPSIHFFVIFTLYHEKALGLIAQSFISIPLHALISDKLLSENIPSFFGGGGKLNVRHMLFSHGGVNDVESQVIELRIHGFSSCHVVWIDGLEQIGRAHV